MEFDKLTCVKVTPGPVTEVVITRPKALNALNQTVLAELDQVLAHLEKQAELRCMILTGDGKAFVAGADISHMADASVAEAEAFAAQGQQVFDRLEQLPVPVIAAVNGFALGGGCELALACDLIYASTKAKFGQPEVKLGLMPGFGGTVRLPRKIGQGAAREWIFTGEMVSAEAAKDAGLVREVLDSDALMPRVREIAGIIAQRAPLAVRACKRVLTQATNPAVATHLERWSFANLFGSADTREGTRAFMEKREPNFKGV